MYVGAILHGDRLQWQQCCLLLMLLMLLAVLSRKVSGRKEVSRASYHYYSDWVQNQIEKEDDRACRGGTERETTLVL